jgi:hypothetical protein
MKTRYAVLFLMFVAMVAVPMSAQPFGSWLVRTSTTTAGFVEIPHSSAFDFSTGFTLEAWVNGSDTGSCTSIAGKRFTNAWWIGVCGTTLRSYIKGTSSLVDGGKVAANDWVHIAVTYDGTTRKHYIDGELVQSRAESGPMLTNTDPIRLDSDVAYNFSYGSLDEVRIWNVARSQAEIRGSINKTINAPTAGLVAVYHLDGSGADSIGGHNGLPSGPVAYLNAPVALTCGSTTSTQLCLSGSRFTVTAKWQTPDGVTGIGTVVPGSSASSGLFWFFSPDNWEVMIKVLDGCGVNGYKWAFSAATTNVHYQLIVGDVRTGQIKRYFNYQGEIAAAQTDVTAFQTCP